MQVFSGKALQAIRKSKGLTQKSLGESIGTTERVVQFWEGDSRMPSATLLLRAMVLLGCTPQDLLKEP